MATQAEVTAFIEGELTPIGIVPWHADAAEVPVDGCYCATCVHFTPLPEFLRRPGNRTTTVFLPSRGGGIWMADMQSTDVAVMEASSPSPRARPPVPSTSPDPS